MSRTYFPGGCTGIVEGTGAAIAIALDFKPKKLQLFNIDGDAILEWNDKMGAGEGMKHKHAVPAGTIAMTNVDASGGTPAGDNAASTVQMVYRSAMTANIVLPAMTLVYNADPGTNLDATVVHAVPDASLEMATLESDQESAADTYFSSANDGEYWNSTAQRAYGFVKHVVGSTGVQIFVDEADSDKLKADFTDAGSPGDKVVPMRMDSGIVFLNIIDADTATMKALYYDDNGVDDAKLVFVDTGAAGGVVHASNKVAGAMPAVTVSGIIGGVAAAQVFTGTALGDHGHVNTAAFTGTSQKLEFLSSNGVTVGNAGFIIGADSDVNVSGEKIAWIAVRG